MTREAEPLLAIIITSFNYEAFIAHSIKSVVSQLDERCELIVVDDGSTDRSWEIIQGYGIPKTFQLTNGGARKACLHAFEHTKAPFILLLDSDDALAPGCLARILPFLRPGVAKLQFALTPIDERGAVIGPSGPTFEAGERGAQLMRDVIQTGSYTSPPTSGNVFCREICELLGEVDYEVSVDGVTLFAAPFFGDVICLPEPLGFYRLHGRNHSQSGSRPEARRFRMEADRFLLRHEHLGRILAARRQPQRLPDGKTVFYYRERRLYQKILEGGRPTVGDVAPIVWLLVKSSGPLSYRLAMIGFLILCLCLPQRSLTNLLDYRFRTGGRSAAGLIRHMFAVAG